MLGWLRRTRVSPRNVGIHGLHGEAGVFLMQKRPAAHSATGFFYVRSSLGYFTQIGQKIPRSCLTATRRVIRVSDARTAPLPTPLRSPQVGPNNVVLVVDDDVVVVVIEPLH